jgi:hypothetical protein
MRDCSVSVPLPDSTVVSQHFSDVASAIQGLWIAFLQFIL